MPEIGEIKPAWELGYKGHKRFIFQACVDCGKLRWVILRRGKGESLRCQSCGNKGGGERGINSHHWKGGRTESRGYIFIRLQPDDFFYPMTDHRGYVFEHRLVVAKALCRCLLPWEVVHHKGTKYPSASKENRGDNRYPENLQLLNDKKFHIIDSLIKTRIKRQDNLIKELQARVTLLEAEIVRLNEETLKRSARKDE